VQARAVVHDTPLRLLSTPAAFGVETTCQLTPFQRSANVTGNDEPGLGDVCPTAKQKRVVGQDTANKKLPLPGGLGVGWMCQADPFHRSASVAEPELVEYSPTAMQARCAGHDTPLNTAPVEPAGFGLGSIDHPFAAAPAGDAMKNATTSPTIEIRTICSSSLGQTQLSRP
jgi:hypothetical protein